MTRPVERGRAMYSTAAACVLVGPLVGLLVGGFVTGAVTLESNFRYVIEAVPVLGFAVAVGASLLARMAAQSEEAEAPE